MNEMDFLNNLGFSSNPFQHTNADEEELLEKYFVPPPYFQSVWGDPQRPKSCVIFAPRGAGKSAQRRMLEIRGSAPGSKVLCVQYSRFEIEGEGSLASIDLGYHLKNIIQLCTIAFFLKSYELGVDHLSYTDQEKQWIQQICAYYLSDVTPEGVKEAVDSIKSPAEKAKQFLSSKLWAINALIAAAAINFKVSPSAVTITSPSGAKSIASPSKLHLSIIISLIYKLGHDSVSILIDKVDETSYTGNDAKNSYALIAPLLRDLELLEMKGVGFKFFLWNELQPYHKKYSRPDRVQHFDLSWTPDELRKIMAQRLQAFARNGAPKFQDLLSLEMGLSERNAVERLLITLSHGSPRDMVRLCRQMIIEELRFNPQSSERISRQAVKAAFDKFCKTRAEEIVPEKVLEELKKNHRLDFTVSHVASNVFKISTNAARTKINNWVTTGVVRHIDEIIIKSKEKPVYHYAVVDSRVAKSIFSELGFVEFLNNKMKSCVKCGMYVYRDWDISQKHICHNCKCQFPVSSAK